MRLSGASSRSLPTARSLQRYWGSARAGRGKRTTLNALSLYPIIGRAEERAGVANRPETRFIRVATRWRPGIENNKAALRRLVVTPSNL